MDLSPQVINEKIWLMAIYWTADKIKEGLERFNKEHGHYPSVTEIDKTPYLPSARQIQRMFGGVKNFRKTSGFLISDFSSGKERSEIASKSGKVGRSGEKLVEKMLTNHFGEEFVHLERVWGQTKQRLDFFVYNPEIPFGVEVITAADKNSFNINLNIKIRRYTETSYPLFFVIIGHALTQEVLNELLSKKKHTIPNNSKVLSLEQFKQKISTYPRYFARLS